MRYREFDIENPPHEVACAHKISFLLMATIFIVLKQKRNKNDAFELDIHIQVQICKIVCYTVVDFVTTPWHSRISLMMLV